MTLEIACHTQDFGTVGQIEVSDLADIASAGYKSIINNRPDGEGGSSQPLSAEIAAAAKEQGLAYAYLPVISGQMTHEQVEEMTKLLQTLPKPVLAFCRSGARSTQLYMFTQRLV